MGWDGIGLNGMAIGYHRYSKSTFDSHKKRRWVLGKEDLDVTGFEDNKIYRKQTLCSQKENAQCSPQWNEVHYKYDAGEHQITFWR